MNRSAVIHSRRQTIGLILILLLILGAFAIFVDWPTVGEQLRAANLRLLGLASALLLAGLLAYAARWRLLLANQVSLAQTFHAANIGHAANIVIPARAGELLRIVAINRAGGVSLTAATSSFVIERLLEQALRLAALGGAVVFGAGLHVTPLTAVGSLGFVLLVGLGLGWLARRPTWVEQHLPRWLARLPRVNEADARTAVSDFLHNLQGVAQPRRLLLALSWSVLSWGLFWGFFYATLRAITGFTPAQWLPVSLGALALSPPSAPTQPGIFHASVVGPLTAVAFPATPLTTYAVLLHLQEMAWMLALSLFGLLQLRLTPRTLSAMHAPDQPAD